jgi:hypothetical protein
MFASHMFVPHYTEKHCTEQKKSSNDRIPKNYANHLLRQLTYSITLVTMTFVSPFLYLEAITSIADSQTKDACQVCNLQMCSTYSAIHILTYMSIQIIHTMNFSLILLFLILYKRRKATLIMRLRIAAPLNLQLRSTILTVKHIVYLVSLHYSEKIDTEPHYICLCSFQVKARCSGV